MQFQMNEITQITEVTRDRLKQWLKLGWIIPSVKKASGPGSRNIFNLNDLYRIAIFKVLTENKSGFYREAAAKLVDAIEDKDLNELIAIGQYKKLSLLKLELMSKLLSDEHLEGIYKAAKGKANLVEAKTNLKQLFIEGAKSWSLQVGLYLVFLWLSVGEASTVHCIPIVEDDPDFDSTIKMGMTFTDAISILKKADSFYALDFSKIMDKIDGIISHKFPEKIAGQTKSYYKYIEKIFQKSEDQKIHTVDFVKKLSQFNF